ncbi:MAG: hypothetical protein HY537_01095 [Deltaproteobacteria bacterium]|nr:hypothetical protein [Deltaproteobacteria bacterium]
MTAKLTLISLGLISSICFAALEMQPIPRTSTGQFRAEGLFEGGSFTAANIEELRLASHGNFERLVIDFSAENNRMKGLAAPRFQLRYIKGERKTPARGQSVAVRLPKFILILRNIRKNFLHDSAIKKLIARSNLLKDIILYPPVEEGDMALELTLKKDVLFEPHQPLEKEGRLVLDIKESRETSVSK